jgi:hypothetical protein
VIMALFHFDFFLDDHRGNVQRKKKSWKKNKDFSFDSKFLALLQSVH